MERKGVHYRAVLEGGNMAEFNSALEFFITGFKTVLGITRKIYYRVMSYFGNVKPTIKQVTAFYFVFGETALVESIG